MMDELQRYSDLMERRKAIAEQLASLDAEISETMAIIEAEAKKDGDVFGYGYHAGYKPGRKSTNHEAAAKWANVPGEIVKKYTKVKETIAWAQVTKAANVDVTNFTVIGEPVFFIEEFLEAQQP